jgi:hypothetical protein
VTDYSGHRPDHKIKRQDAFEAEGLTALELLDAILSDIDPKCLGPNGLAVLAKRQAIKARIPKPSEIKTK